MAEITIHESTDEAGHRTATRLSCDDGQLAIAVGAELLPLPEGALEAVMKRYGKPLDVATDADNVIERLSLGEGRSLVRFRFLARYDVIAKDYLVLYEADAEPLCELATAIAAVLDHLARRFAEKTAAATDLLHVGPVRP